MFLFLIAAAAHRINVLAGTGLTVSQSIAGDAVLSHQAELPIASSSLMTRVFFPESGSRSVTIS